MKARQSILETTEQQHTQHVARPAPRADPPQRRIEESVGNL